MADVRIHELLGLTPNTPAAHALLVNLGERPIETDKEDS